MGNQLGADYYIPKPFTMDQVVYGLDVVFGRTDESKQDPEEEPPKKVPVHRLDFDPDGVN